MSITYGTDERYWTITPDGDIFIAVYYHDDGGTVSETEYLHCNDLFEVYNATGKYVDLSYSDFFDDIQIRTDEILNESLDLDFPDYDLEAARDLIWDTIEYFGYHAAKRFIRDYVENGTPVPTI